jgi:4-amino-4-deoxychorismate lyase
MKDIQFIETMRVSGGSIAHLQDHADRMCATISEVYGHTSDFASLLSSVSVPAGADKCRIVYDEHIRSVEFGSYTPRTIGTLMMVEADTAVDYHLKYLDRTVLTQLQARRGSCDEVLIVKYGVITDTSFSNVVLTDGRRFVTPSTCLLPGTMRARLLRAGLVAEAAIRPADLHSYTHITLVNAMLPLSSERFIPISNIRTER